MSRWYYSTNGKAEGPVTPEVLIENLKSGRFTLVDLVFKEGDSAWKTFGEIPAFRDVYQAPPPAVVVAPVPPAPARTAQSPSRPLSEFHEPEGGWPSDWRLSSSWIILRKKSDGSGYDQDGPFTAEHIIEMIASGKIDYSQYCWKPGYTRWFRIGNLPEFDRRKRDRENDPVNQIVPVPEIVDELPALSREELLANVERLRRPVSAQKESLGKNLIEDGLEDGLEDAPAVIVPKPAPAKPKITPPPTAIAQPPKPAPAPSASESVIVDASTSPSIEISRPVASQQKTPAVAKAKVRPNAASPKALRFGVAAFIAGVVVFAMINFSSLRHRATTALTSASTTHLHPRQPTSVPHSQAKPLAPKEPPHAATAPAAKPASVLEIVPMKLETSGPSLAFQTDVPVGEAIKVSITARTGDVLKYASFSKSIDVSRAGGELPTLDLTKHSLPSGTYTVEASAGAVKTTKQIFIGQKDAAFASALERHLKSISYRQQLERSSLFYGSLKLEKATKELLTQSQSLKGQPTKWKAACDVWRTTAREATAQIATLKQAPLWETAYPDQLASFASLSEQLVTQVNAIDESVGQKREIASEPGLESALTNLSRLRDETTALSGRPAAQAANN